MPLTDGTCECCRLDAALAPGGELVVLSRMIFPGGIRDFGLVRTGGSDGGNVQRATQDQWRINGCPEHGGALAIGDDGGHHLTWFTQGQQRQGSFYARSADDGATWSEPLSLGDPGALPGHADVLALGPDVFVAWRQFDGRRTSVQLRVSADGGRQFAAPVELAASGSTADYPRLVSDGRQVFVSWYAEDAGYRLLPAATSQAPAGPAAGPSAAQPFRQDSLSAIARARAGQRFLLVMWSLDCPPCLKELREFAALKAAGRSLPLVLVSTDDLARSAEVDATLAEFGLPGVESWIFADANAQQLRYAVDPRWYGELPRGYFYAPDGTRKAHSGGLTRADIEAWLDQSVTTIAANFPTP